MRRLILFFQLSVVLFYSCNSIEKENPDEERAILEEGVWRGILQPQNVEIPFNFFVERKGDSYKLELRNAEERIPLEEVLISNDSIHIPLYIFDATIHARIEETGIMNGFWVKNYADDYIVPFRASFHEKDRFMMQNEEMFSSFDGKWEVDFIEEDTVEKAIGIFEQDGNHLTGTFLLSTGDYRFLEGSVEGNVMKLSCFDGTHAYLFEARMNENGEIAGDFWSGKTWHQEWTARKNEDFVLPDPYSMTYMKEGIDEFEMKFPNISGDTVSLTDARFKNKVVVVQLLGTWCPNCMDETRFYVDWSAKNKNRGVEIVGLAFERKADFDYAVKRISNMKEKLKVDYEILFAGSTSQESRRQALPMLNKIYSFPTSIILDKEHNVRKIHSGFSGPGTGEYYDRFVEEFNFFMDKLIQE